MKFSFNGLGKSTALAAALAAGSMNSVAQTATADEPLLHKVFVVHDDDDDEEKEVKVRVNVTAPSLWLGISLKPVEGDLARYLDTESGILVDSVYPDSPANKAGVKEGDVIMAASGTKLGEPSDLLKVMSDLDKDDPSVTLAVLRKGKKMEIAVKAAERPEMKEVNDLIQELDIDVEGLGNNAEIKSLLKGLRLGANGDEVNVFRFGSPAIVMDDFEGDQEIDLVVTAEDAEEGQSKFKIKIQRENDKPATITVETGDEVTEVTEEEIDELPEEIQEKVKKALGRTSGGFWMADGDVRVVGPNWMDLRLKGMDVEKLNGVEIRKRAREMAEKAREMAEKHRAEAEENASRARSFRFRTASDSAEMEELRDLVKQLQKQVKELQSKLNDK